MLFRATCRFVSFGVLALAFLACQASGKRYTGSENYTGNVLISGGVITTLNPAQPSPEALAFNTQGLIIAVGDLDEVKLVAGHDAQHIDLAGASLLPGFQDVHIHAVEAGLNEARCLLSEFGSAAQYRREMKACSKAQRNSPWFVGAGVSLPDLLDWTDNPAAVLDEIIPDKPALILDNLGHGAWANHRALAAVGYEKYTGSPAGGIIMRDRHGVPNGLVFENAQQALRSAAFPPDAANKAANTQALRWALGVLAQNGITSVSDAGGYWPRAHHEAWKQLEKSGEMSVRARNAFYLFPDKTLERQISDISALRSSVNGSSSKLVRFDQVKIYVDGIISQGTAKLKAPYTPPPGIVDVSPTGFEYFPRDELFEYAKRFDALGFSLHFHATGDAGVKLALDAIEAARQANGNTKGQHRITHVFMLDGKEVVRFDALGVTADIQMTPSSMSAATGRFYRSLIGDRASKLIPVQSLSESGANVTLSSDWDADELNPMVKIKQALGRKNGQAIPNVETALKMMTINPAKLLGQADLTGTLEVGKWADLVILDKNILTQPTDRIDKIKVRATLLAGQPVYDEQGLFAELIRP